jgi:hypothetical protein
MSYYILMNSALIGLTSSRQVWFPFRSGVWANATFFGFENASCSAFSFSFVLKSEGEKLLTTTAPRTDGLMPS